MTGISKKITINFIKTVTNQKKEGHLYKTSNHYLNITNQNIEELIKLCKENNQKAQFEVYNRYCKAMYNVAYRIVKDEHFAQDVMQEGFLKAFTKINDYKQEVHLEHGLKKSSLIIVLIFIKRIMLFRWKT